MRHTVFTFFGLKAFDARVPMLTREPAGWGETIVHDTNARKLQSLSLAQNI